MKDRYHICIIDDEVSIQKTLTLALEAEGYRVSSYNFGLTAMEEIKTNLPDLIILDIMMQGLDGITFCSLFRKQDYKIPIIFISSRSDELTKLEALERGGDDYLSKPFSIKELMVRISVCLRKVAAYNQNPAISISKNNVPFVINEIAWQVYVNNQLVNFTVTEFRIFTTLYNNPQRVFNREDLMKRAYPEDCYISDRNVDTHITRIRKKIIKHLKDFKGIKSVYGLGYRYDE